MECGERCAITIGEEKMQLWLAGNWAMLIQVSIKPDSHTCMYSN